MVDKLFISKNSLKIFCNLTTVISKHCDQITQNIYKHLVTEFNINERTVINAHKWIGYLLSIWYDNTFHCSSLLCSGLVFYLFEYKMYRNKISNVAIAVTYKKCSYKILFGICCCDKEPKHFYTLISGEHHPTRSVIPKQRTNICH